MADPHFEISAAVVRQLGEELVSDEVTAIVELVKNAYDADATFANVVVNTTAPPTNPGTRFPGAKGVITIEDDGFGMGSDDIQRGWLVISLSGKRAMKARGAVTPKGRTPLGDKGLGRLSTQKLGSNLELVTRCDGDASALHVSFSWKTFTEERSLASVPVTITTGSLARPHGTLLVISDLRDPEVWKGAAGERLARDLSQIISPFPEARAFNVSLQIDGVPVDLGQISSRARNAAVGRFVVDYREQTLTLTGRVRLAKLRGNQRDEDLQFFEKYVVPTNGADFLAYLADRRPPVRIRKSEDASYFIEFDYEVSLAALGEVKKVRGKDAEPTILDTAADPGPFHAELDEFLLRPDESGLRLSGLTNSSDIQQLVKRHAGIKVFRDGFGVRPYGVNGEDWLRLGAQQTSASSYYGLRPSNVIGFVAISEAANGNLKEKTDREGFVANQYSENFRRLLMHSTEKIGAFYDWLRRSYNEYRQERTSSSPGMEAGGALVQSAASIAAELTAFGERSAMMSASVADTSQKLGSVAERVRAEPLLVTQAERELAPLMVEAAEALGMAQQLLLEQQQYAERGRALAAIVESLGPRLDVLRDQLSDFSELAGLGLLAEALSHEVQNQTDRLMQKAQAANQKARKTVPPNADLLVFGHDVAAAASALRRQIGHLAPSLRHQRERRESFSIATALEDVRAYFTERWEGSAVSVEVQDGLDFAVRTNRGRLLQVLDNLLLNSEYWLKETPPPQPQTPTVFISYSAPVVRVWDNGPGVAPSVEASLFEPFVTLKPKDSGRGLGLFITSQILESMNCRITLLHERNAFGRRHVFEIDLAGIMDGG